MPLISNNEVGSSVRAKLNALPDPFGNDLATTTGLNYGFKSGVFGVGTEYTSLDADVIGLTDNATNYVFINTGEGGSISANTSGFSPSDTVIPLALVITSGGGITSITDKRVFLSLPSSGGGGDSLLQLTISGDPNSSSFQVVEYQFAVGTIEIPTTGTTGLSSANLVETEHDFSVENFPDCTSLSFPSLVSVGGNFNAITLPVLTTFDFPALTTVSGIQGVDIQDVYLLEALTLTALTTVTGEFAVQGMDACTSMDVSNMTSCGGFHIFDSLFIEVSAPALTTTNGGAVVINGLADMTTLSLPNVVGDAINIQLYDCPSLTTVDLSALATPGGINIHDNAVLATLSFPALTALAHSFLLQNMPSLTSLNFPAAVNFTGTGFSITSTTGTDALSSVSFGSSLLSVGGDVVFSSCALDQASVDGILVALAALDGTSGTTSYDDHTVTLTGTSSPPSVTGAVAKATLEGRGNTVNVIS